MFGIDPVSYHANQNNFVLEQRMRNFYAEILKRALEDLLYYKHQANNDSSLQWEAYNNAKNAQLWLDDKIKTSAVTADTIRKILDIEKSTIDRYIDNIGIRFDPNDRSKCATKRQRLKLQSLANKNAKQVKFLPVYKPCQITHQPEDEGDQQNTIPTCCHK